MIADVARRTVGGAQAPAQIFDNFNAVYSDIAGQPTSDGEGVWEKVYGNTISSNGAEAVGSGTGNTIYTVDFGRNSQKNHEIYLGFTVSSFHGGDSLYFRVIDDNNWWRLRYWQDRVTRTSSGYYITEYQCCNMYYEAGTYGGYASGGGSHHGHTYCHPTWSSTKAGATCYDAVSLLTHMHGYYGVDGNYYYNQHAHPWNGSRYNTRQTYVSGSTSYYGQGRVYLERCVNGSVSVRKTHSVSRTSISGISVEVTPTTIQGHYWYGNNKYSVGSPETSQVHSEATKVGIGRGYSQYATGSGMDEFRVALAA